jgi:hypothetical protein
MVDWRAELALNVTSLFCEANRKRLPKSLAEWEEVAERYQRELHVSRTGASKGATFDEIVVVRDNPSEFVVAQRFAHELAEYLLRSEWDRPYCYQSSLSGDEEVHRIARMVEVRIEEERQAERLRLEAERAEEEALHQRLAEQVRAMSQQMMQYAQAALESLDFFGMTPPDPQLLRKARQELLRHTERLTSIEARLRCI